MFFYWLWLKKSLLSFRYIFQFSSLFSFLSLILGIASLTIALLFVNGFSSGLEKSIVDMNGHVVILTDNKKSKTDLLIDISPYRKFIKSQSLFLSSEALALSSTKFQPLIIEAIEDNQLHNSQFLSRRILQGKIRSSKDFILVGKAIAKEMDLKIGSVLPIVVSNDNKSYFSRQKKQFKVGAVADFGRYSFNSRYVVMALSVLQQIKTQKNKTSVSMIKSNDFQEKVSGIRLWLKDGRQSESLAYLIGAQLEESYQVYSWKDLDRNFFKMIEMDKKIIFFVLLILILAAGFNVSSSLFVQVFKKTKDIGILKSMGAKKALIRNIFILQGFVMGLIGTCLGILLGWIISFILIGLQNKFNFIPEQVHQVNQIVLEWKSWDMMLIFFSSLVVVMLSSLLPARRAYKLNVKEALSYE